MSLVLAVVILSQGFWISDLKTRDTDAFWTHELRKVFWNKLGRLGNFLSIFFWFERVPIASASTTGRRTDRNLWINSGQRLNQATNWGQISLREVGCGTFFAQFWWRRPVYILSRYMSIRLLLHIGPFWKQDVKQRQIFFRKNSYNCFSNLQGTGWNLIILFS